MTEPPAPQPLPVDGQRHTRDEIRDKADEVYPTNDKMSDTAFRQQQLRQIAFRAGAHWAFGTEDELYRAAPPTPSVESEGEAK
jgi:hypothetical protein